MNSLICGQQFSTSVSWGENLKLYSEDQGRMLAGDGARHSETDPIRNGHPTQCTLRSVSIVPSLVCEGVLREGLSARREHEYTR